MRYAFIFSIFSILMLAAATSSSAQSVAGEWDGAFETPGGARPFKLVLSVDGETLSGTVKRSSGDAPITGTIKGSDIAFSYTINYNGNALTLSFTGMVTVDTMNGAVNFGGNADDSWSAKRAVAEKPKTE